MIVKGGMTVPRKSLCWLALACLVVPMFGSYFFDDMFSSISFLFSDPSRLELGWDAAGYGLYTSGYSVLCVFGGLIVCGYSVYHNWYVETYDYYQGIIFDKEYVLTFTPDTYPKMTRPYVGTEADWFPYDADVEY